MILHFLYEVVKGIFITLYFETDYLGKCNHNLFSSTELNIKRKALIKKYASLSNFTSKIHTTPRSYSMCRKYILIFTHWHSLDSIKFKSDILFIFWHCSIPYVASLKLSFYGSKKATHRDHLKMLLLI